MPKMTGISITRRISLDDIIDTGNVRKLYEGIEELAASIKKNGLLQPVVVKHAAPTPDGTPRFELVAGFRRRAAFQWLREHGDDFAMIDAVVVTGDKLTLQLIENIQRADLTPSERERGVYQMCESGLLQKEVAAELSKTESWVSRQVSAYRIRQTAEAADMDTSTIETNALCAIQTAQEEDIPELIGLILQNGGTVEAARRVMNDYRENKTHATAVAKEITGYKPLEKALAADEMDVRVLGQSMSDHQSRTTPPHERQSWTHDPDKPPIRHKQVDVNDIFDEIYKYIQSLSEKSAVLGGAASFKARSCEVKTEAAWDIIALIHKRIDA